MKKRDLILAAAVLILAGILWLLFCGSRKEGKNVVIKVDGAVFGVYSLSENQEIVIGDTNRCRIGDGKVWMESADCPDQICVRTKAASKAGDTVVCLPNRVALEVTGETEQTGTDAIAG